ncbi:MAG TPA: ABC transporter permease [Jiangellaceae bacterium]|nr:ABC transporter permease [Jiangellaceae bacterium]
MMTVDTQYISKLRAGEGASLAEELGLQQIGVRPPLRRYLQGLWARRQFAWTMATSNAYARNRNNYLGQLWNILNPLLWSAVYFLAFGVLLGARGGMDTQAYIAFLVTGVFMFRFISAAMTLGAKSISGNISLVRSLHFPRAVLPISTVLTELVVLLPALVVLCLIVLVTGQGPSWAWLLFPLATVLIWMFCTGLALIIARLVADVRDLANLLPFLTRLLLYTSGVFYSIERFKDSFYDNGIGWLYPVAENQPVAVYLTLARSTLLDDASMDGRVWILGVGYALLFLIGGFLFFWRAEERYGRD